MSYAGVAIRYLAILLDLVVLSAVFFPVTRIVKGTWILSATNHRWAHGWFVTDPLCLIFLAVMILYFVLFEAFPGATPGKVAAGLRVRRPDGGRPGLTRSLVRNLLRVVDGLPALGILGAVLIATSSERTRLGDRLAQTRVVLSRAKT
jgi:uncharacterized RDD family membrane protein YckC